MLKENIRNFRQPVYVRTIRSPETYQATKEYTYCKLSELVEKYRSTKNNEQTARLIRDDIDFALRRYHEYCIKQNFDAHYIEVGLEGNGIFEHMIPASVVRDLLIAETITSEQACNVPTCKLSKENDDSLREKGWVSKTPNIYNFWERYEYCFETAGKFTTWDGVDASSIENLDQHFNYFLN
jgi:hypothetical protein